MNSDFTLDTQNIRLPNPLDRFQSYSIHYVMLAARSTEAAGEFVSNTKSEDQAFMTSVQNAKFLGDVVRLSKENSSTTPEAYLVLDTRRFSQFTVENLKYDVLINGLLNRASPANLATDLSMTILDSVGISFSNFLQWLMDDRLKCNFDGMVFLLRLIFVGHNPDGTTEVIQSEVIPMHLFRVEIDLNFARGSYLLEFMPNMNFNGTRHARFLQVGNATSCKTDSGNSLLSIINSFQDELNKITSTHFDEVQKIFGISDSSKEKYGRKVQYQITIPGKWAKFKVNGISEGATTVETLFSSAAPKTASTTSPAAKDTHLTIPPTRTIPEVLDKLFSMTDQVMELGTFKQARTDAEEIIFYKTIVGITSDDSTVYVHVDVLEFVVPNLFTRKKNTSAPAPDKYYVSKSIDGVTKNIPKNFFTYDYIFTGRNKDILNLEIKIQDFQFLLASNLKVGAAAVAQVTKDSGKIDEEVQLAKELLNLRKYDALLPSLQTEAQKKAMSNFSKTSIAASSQSSANHQQYMKNLSMFYAASPIVISMTIRGNPEIMHKFNIGKFPPPIKLNGSKNKEDYRKILEDEILKSLPSSIQRTDDGSLAVIDATLNDETYVTSPVFIMINIKGPNVDFRTNEPIAGADYTSAVISDNFYTVFKVTNTVAGHNFTQDLELYSHNIFGVPKLTAETAVLFGAEQAAQ